ncbi:MAG: hypothetical protein WD851_14980 [Pirellulales bacterium]
MAKAMSIAGMAIAGLIAVLFGLDLVLGIPFGGQIPLTDIAFVICGGILGYLGWNAYRDAR